MSDILEQNCTIPPQIHSTLTENSELDVISTNSDMEILGSGRLPPIPPAVADDVGTAGSGRLPPIPPADADDDIMLSQAVSASMKSEDEENIEGGFLWRPIDNDSELHTDFGDYSL